MEFLFFILLIIIFFALFSVHKGDDGTMRIKSRLDRSTQKPKNSSLLASIIKSQTSLLKLLTTFFIINLLITFFSLISPIQTLVAIRASQLIPDKFQPIARFAANMDWESKTISLDASMSKTYKDVIKNYVWRIDDGTSFIGTKTLKHTFSDPGYYYIQLSIVDGDDQSDVATCQILIPPKEVERISKSETLTESNVVPEKVTDVKYDLAPVGTFFNYTKMDSDQRSYANLKSQYIESGCGYSNTTYNTASNTLADFLHNYDVQQALATMLGSVLIGFVAIPFIYVFLVIVIKRKIHKKQD